MIGGTKKQLLDDGLDCDNRRESKRMRLSSDSRSTHPASEGPQQPSTDTLKGVSETSPTEESSSTADTHDVMKKHAKSINRSTSVGCVKPGKGKQKDQTKSERRNRRGTRNNELVVEGEDAGVPKTPRLPKRQCALLIGFCGSGYSGMQMYGC